MIYALDSNIVSYLLKGDAGVQERFQAAVDDGNHYVISKHILMITKLRLLSREPILMVQRRNLKSRTKNTSHTSVIMRDMLK